ncbi:hypothetical protein C8J57DRAFT_1323945 [Mycena rebaudengoi]|nr:hypothetical protein C8J57DRAFT_1323945 [Mycena rebaudengoi]
MIFKFTTFVAVITLAALASAIPTEITQRDEVVCISGATCTCPGTTTTCICRPEGTFCNLSTFCSGGGDSGCQ